MMNVVFLVHDKPSDKSSCLQIKVCFLFIFLNFNAFYKVIANIILVLLTIFKRTFVCCLAAMSCINN